MSLFVDTSVWYAAADAGDAGNDRAHRVLGGGERLITTDHVLVEIWTLLHHRIHATAAECFWAGIRGGVAQCEIVRTADLEVAWEIGRAFPDQDFSIVDRTSFAVMRRLGLSRVASFDADFAVYRFGPSGRRSFEVVR
ncbi:MAG: type II toxin-antitoxin system VapC family toxin [Planctomycetota bacterium]